MKYKKKIEQKGLIGKVISISKIKDKNKLRILLENYDLEIMTDDVKYHLGDILKIDLKYGIDKYNKLEI